MEYLGLLLEHKLRLISYQALPCGNTTLEGKCFHPLGADTYSIFYDWLFGTNGLVVGVELHIDEADHIFEPLWRFRNLPYISFDGPFPRIWFWGHQQGQPRAMEAFPAQYFVTESSDWLVILPTAEWLSSAESEQLSNAIRESA